MLGSWWLSSCSSCPTCFTFLSLFYPRFRFCRGCKIDCTEDRAYIGNANIAVDWDPTALHLRYQTSQERVKRKKKVVWENVSCQEHLVSMHFYAGMHLIMFALFSGAQAFLGLDSFLLPYTWNLLALQWECSSITAVGFVFS